MGQTTTESNVVEVADDVVELDTDSTELTETFEISNSIVERGKLAEKMAFKNNTDRVWFVKKGIMGYTNHYRKIKEEEEKSSKRSRPVSDGIV